MQFYIQREHKATVCIQLEECIQSSRLYTKEEVTRVATASPKVLKIFSHPQTRDQSQVVQNDKLSQESVETKIFVGGNGTFSHFFEKKLKKMWEKISKKKFFFTKICFSELEKAYVQLFVLNFFLSRS